MKAYWFLMYGCTHGCALCRCEWLGFVPVCLVKDKVRPRTAHEDQKGE